MLVTLEFVMRVWAWFVTHFIALGGSQEWVTNLLADWYLP